MEDKDVFGERLSLLRKEKGITRQKAADDMEITRAALEYYEKGKRMPSVGMVSNIAKYYGVSVDYLLGVSEYRNPENEKPVTELHLSERAVELLKKPDNLFIINAILSCDPKVLSDLSKQITYYLNADRAAKGVVSVTSFSESDREEIMNMWRSAIMNKISADMETVLNQISNDSNLMSQLPQIGCYPVPLSFTYYQNGNVDIEISNNEE